MKKLRYDGTSKVILRIVERINYLLDNGGGGHTIIDNGGQAMTTRAGLQIKGATTTDDSTNDRTVVQVPTKLSEFTNDEQFIKKSVNNLENYYTKNETYTQNEVNNLIPDVDSQLSATSTNPVQNKVIKARLDEVFTSVSNGKALIASAITDKGVPTQSDATFAVMAQNISDIPSGSGPKFLAGMVAFVPLRAKGGVGIGNLATIIERQ